MGIEEKDISIFFSELSNSLGESDVLETDNVFLNNGPLNNKECYYIFDLTLGKVIDHKGFKKVFGYPDKEISYDLILQNYHPEDIETILRISKATISHCLSEPFECKDSLLQITYRFKNSMGDYIKVLSQSSSYTMNKDGFMTAILVKLTDISFLENTRYVNWHFNASNLNKDAFRKQVYSAYIDFFTNREIDIIKEIALGNTTKRIADKLKISEHTVATHRKNILNKANRHNIEDLLLFCKRKGII